MGTLHAYHAQQVAAALAVKVWQRLGGRKPARSCWWWHRPTGWLGPAGLARQPGQRMETTPRWWQHAERGRHVKGDAHDPGPGRAARRA
jgi:hypothetical protein